jgi:hypothetical protein
MIYNLCSGREVIEHNASQSASSSGLVVTRNEDNAIILTGSFAGGMVELHQRLRVLHASPDGCEDSNENDSSDDSSDGHALACDSGKVIPLHLAHERLGHIGISQVKQLAAGKAVTGLNISDSDFHACTTCNRANQTRASFLRPPIVLLNFLSLFTWTLLLL